MARISAGNDLTGLVLQPGWKLTDDGFGLQTITATFTTNNGSTPFERGEAFPVENYNWLKLHKQTSSMNALDIQVISRDYVGIHPSVNSGTMTLPNTSVANGLTSENITSHPNFFYTAAPFTEYIAGKVYVESDLGPTVKDTNGKPKKSYVGLNGSCFERSTGGRFIGFVDPDFPSLFGKTNYLATTTTYSGIVYLSEVTYVQAIIALLNTATSTNSWGTFNLIPAWAIIGAGTYGNKNLLSQVNVEEFGSLYKVSYEIRYSKEGWDPKVYVNLAGA